MATRPRKKPPASKKAAKKKPARKPLFARVALIGIGLIGASMAHAMRRDGALAGHIAVCARTRKSLAAARRLGIADSTYLSPARAVKGADLVVLCTPVGAFSEAAAAIGPHLEPGAIVTDVGSVKQAALRDIGPHMPEHVHLIPGHPVAGTEHSGPEAGFATLFDGRWTLLTPPEGADAKAVDRLARLWKRLGSKVDVMDPEHHDQILAMTSHIPHLIAFSVVGTAMELAEDVQPELFRFSAGGFRDFTRIAASDPVMWRDIFLNNREAVMDLLHRLDEHMTVIQRAIRRGDGAVLHELFERARTIRRGVIEAEQA